VSSRADKSNRDMAREKVLDRYRTHCALETLLSLLSL